MVSNTLAFIDVANIAFAFSECWRNVFENIFVCKNMFVCNR